MEVMHSTPCLEKCLTLQLFSASRGSTRVASSDFLFCLAGGTLTQQGIVETAVVMEERNMASCCGALRRG